MSDYLKAVIYLRPQAKIAIVGGDSYENIQWGEETPISKEELDNTIPLVKDREKTKKESKVALAKLAKVDLESIPYIRQFLIDTFKTDNKFPQELIDLEDQAKLEKVKVK